MKRLQRFGVGLWWLGRRLVGEEKGATTAEYALVLALVVVVLIGSLTALGDALTGKLTEIKDQITQ